jgi:hypothetical protein
MTYGEGHEDWMCDKCQSAPKKWLMPILYKDMNDKSHPDEGDGYRRYAVCDECREHENHILSAQFRREMTWWLVEEHEAHKKAHELWLDKHGALHG